MSEFADQPPPEPSINHGHEITDVNPYWIGLFALGLSLMIALVIPLLGWTFWRFEAVAKRTDRPQTSSSDNPMFTGPKLQAQPSIDFVRFREAEDRRLSSYRWVDQQQGIVQIPVERAIKVLAERGLPEPKQPVKPTEAGEVNP